LKNYHIFSSYDCWDSLQNVHIMYTHMVMASRHLNSCNMATALNENATPTTHKFQHVPVKHIVIGEPLSIGVVWFVIKTQRTAEIQVCGKFSCNTRKPYFSFSFTFAFYKSDPYKNYTAKTECCCEFSAPEKKKKHYRTTSF
uniref:Uncharacterized protein n=1 Tax=Cairina moschata TaxID=8855 RepID=A0A8C3BK12_CAIMO